MMMVVDRPGHFGWKRNNRVDFYNNLYGFDLWHECWQVRTKVFSFERAIGYYEEAYLLHLQDHPSLVKFAIGYGECYGYDPANIMSGLVYDQQACPRHLQDTALRRALRSLGVWFEGPKDKLLEIRCEASNGFALHPGNIPFHVPEIILNGDNPGRLPSWAKANSLEAFWVRNKVICLDNLPVLS